MSYSINDNVTSLASTESNDSVVWPSNINNIGELNNKGGNDGLHSTISSTKASIL